MSIAGRLTNVKRISIHHCQAITDAGIKESSREKKMVLFLIYFYGLYRTIKKALAAKFDGQIWGLSLAAKFGAKFGIQVW